MPDVVVVDLDSPGAGSPPGSTQYYSAALARSESAVADSESGALPGARPRVATPTSRDSLAVSMTVNPIGGRTTSTIRAGEVSTGPGPVIVSPLHWPGNQGRLRDAAAIERTRSQLRATNTFLSPAVVRDLRSLGYEEDEEYDGVSSPSRRTPRVQPLGSIVASDGSGPTVVSVSPAIDHLSASIGARSPNRHDESSTAVQREGKP